MSTHFGHAGKIEWSHAALNRGQERPGQATPSSDRILTKNAEFAKVTDQIGFLKINLDTVRCSFLSDMTPGAAPLVSMFWRSLCDMTPLPVTTESS